MVNILSVFRHPILAIDMSPTGDNLYTADVSGVIQCWQVPSANIELHGPYGGLILEKICIN